MPFISIIVPIYNTEAYLKRCIDSILAQTYTDYEIILVNDGSSDRSESICNEYAIKDNRIHILNIYHSGAAAARNAGINWAMENSSSLWLAYIDSDDWVHPQYLEFLLNAATETNTKVSVSRYSRVSEYVSPVLIQQPEFTIENAEDFWCSDNVTATIVCGKLFSKDLFSTLRFPEGKIHEDEFVIYKVLYENEFFSLVNAELYFYYMNLNSVMLSKWSTAHLAALDACLEQISYFKNNGFSKAYRYQAEKFARLCARALDQIERYVEEPKELQEKWYKILCAFMKENKDKLEFKNCPRAKIYTIPGFYYLISSIRKMFRLN